MAGGSDPFQSYFEKVDGGSFKCFFCAKTLARKTSTTRMKYHLARVGGGGVTICEKVTPYVQRAAFDKLPDKMRGNMPSSSNNIIVTADSDPAQDLEMQQQGQSPLDDGLSWMDEMMSGEIVFTEENAALGMHMPDAPETGLGIEPAVQAFETDMTNITLYSIESREWMQAVTERGSCSKMPVDKSVPSSSNNEGINAASTALRALEMEQEEQPLSDEGGWKGLLIGGETELVEEPRAPVVLMPDEPETRQRTEVVRGSSSKRPVHKRPRTTRYDLTTKIVGQAFKRNMKDVCSWLLNDEVSCIGIYGMGGVGKTTLATHILDHLQEKPNIFPCVYWITDSREFSVHALQDLIANAFGLCLQNGKDVMIRARELWTALSVIKGVLILDNLWGDFLPDEVGIPLRTDGWKLILTTRSLEITGDLSKSGASF